MASQNLYFIVCRNSAGNDNDGRICSVSKYTYKPEAPDKLPAKVYVSFLEPRSSHQSVELSSMEELSAEEAEMLLAVPDDAERLRCFRERDALRAALALTVGSAVTVDDGGETMRGVVRYIGRLTEKSSHSPLSGVFFGVELQGEDKGKGKTDGAHKYKRFFTCPKDCGVFVPFSRLRPVVPSSLTPPRPGEPEELSAGDRVTYFISNKCHHGMVLSVQENDGQTMVRISTDKDENGKTGGEVELPLNCIAKGEVPAEPESLDLGASLMAPEDLYTDLTVNSLVEVTLATGSAFGIIRWVGNLPDRQEIMAGLELEEERGVTDGSFRNERLFSCPPKRALFIKLSSCRPDSRFQSTPCHENVKTPGQKHAGVSVAEEIETDHSTGRLETLPPVSAEQVSQILIGRMKGIQGHHNSCYMDAALFSLFSCSSVLDSMLFKLTEPQDAPIQETLLHDIVNPLRRKGFVEGRHIMKLRQQLQKHGYSHSFTTDEKDPEEFLNVIMHHILALDPLLKLSAGGKVQESYCYQIFLDQNHSLVLPTVQQLLEHSFHCAGLKLAEVPSCLILQMPRFGKKFKMFEKIVPSVELDITNLLSEVPQQCTLCGSLAEEECTDCFKDPIFSQTGCKVFCRTCSSQVHSHPQRRSHHQEPLDTPLDYLRREPRHTPTKDKLELFAVLCIETSHYVSFIKYGQNSEDWIFFDSMADREGERDGFNIPEVHACPEVSKYLKMSPAELASEVPRDMEGVAKRLFCDAYMYLYQSTSMCLYR